MPRTCSVLTTSSRARAWLARRSRGLTGRMRSSCTLPSRRTSRASTSIRVSESCEKKMAFPSSPSGTRMRQRCTVMPRENVLRTSRQRLGSVGELRLHLQRGGFVDRGDLPEDVVGLLVQLRELQVGRLELVRASWNHCRRAAAPRPPAGERLFSSAFRRRFRLDADLISAAHLRVCVVARALAALVLPFAHDMVAHGGELRRHGRRAIRDAHVVRPKLESIGPTHSPTGTFSRPRQRKAPKSRATRSAGVRVIRCGSSVGFPSSAGSAPFRRA